MQGKRFYVWDTYWDSHRVHSFDLESKPAALGALAQAWAGFGSQLAPGATVLDIACGNGAAGLALLDAMGRDALTITGIDEAGIDPARYLPEYASDLARIDFMPRVQMEAMPFADNAFDAVVSQFGLESGSQPRTAAEVARILKPGGLMLALVLPQKSAVVQEARIALKQARFLLAEAKLFETALGMMKGYYQSSAEVAEQNIQSGLEAFCRDIERMFGRFGEKEVNVISVIVSVLYKVFINRKGATEEEQVMAIENARTRLAHFAARAQETVRSAVDVNATQLRGALQAAGIQISEAQPIRPPAQEAVAYQLFGRRAA